MVRLREIPRTAAFAWSTSATSPQIVTGTVAGAVDANFSDETTLELWDLHLANENAQVELQPSSTVKLDSRFHAIAWSPPSDGQPAGIIAGALENSTLDLWDASQLQSKSEKARIVRNSKHSGAVRAVQFNPHSTGQLASSGIKGELYITDLTRPSDSYRLGTTAARADDLNALDWNKKVSHILVTGSSGGFANVWDVRAKKESIALNNHGRKPVSAISWDPETSTKLATATTSDSDPLVLLWDLRNTNAPEHVLRQHDQGVLSLSWNQWDPRLLLSSGKDNRTVCWNTRTGEAFGEFPIITNWTFQATWSPRHPSMLATASFDGRVAVQTIQDTNPDSSAIAASAQALDGADFFASAQGRPQGASFSLPVAPTWLERPASVSFGFGGKLVMVGRASGKSSKVSIGTFFEDTSMGEASKKFEEVLQNGDLKEFCESKIADAKSEDEKADWTVIETLISGSRTKLKEYLGFSQPSSQPNGDISEEPTKAPVIDGDDASFFDNPAPTKNGLSAVASSKGVKTGRPFNVYTGKESEADKEITRALILGNFDDALDICLQQKRMSDAFMVAICGGEKCIEKAKAAYFDQASDGPNYLRLLASVAGKNLWDVVHNADLQDWKDVMAAICTYADESNFPDLCEALGDRLDESSKTRKDASFCYLSGSKLEKVVTIWLQELLENEKSSIRHGAEDSSFYSIHANALHEFIEKVTIFRKVTDFQDAELDKTEDWKLETLYSKYSEYADILASQGQLETAQRYLDLLPSKYPESEVARNRVQQAGRKVTAAATQKSNTSSQRGQRVVPTFQAAQPAIPTAATAATSMYGATPAAPASSLYNPPGQPVQPGPPGARPGYGPVGYQPPQQQGYQPPGAAYQPPTAGYGPTPSYGAGFGQFGVVPPPRVSSQSPGAIPPPATKRADLSTWNDTLDVGPKPAPRRGTPTVVTAPVASYGAPSAGPPPGSSYGAPKPSSPMPPPPPKAGGARGPSPATVIPPSATHSQGSAPPSASSYFPPPAAAPPTTTTPPVLPRGASPYNPPPAAGPTSNRYAPAPGAQPTPPTQYGGGPPAPKPVQSPYASRPPGFAPAPPPAAVPPPSTATPPAPPPKGPAPPRVQPPPPAPAGARVNQLPSPQPSDSRPGSSGSGKAGQPTQLYPAGDRSHIPPGVMPIFEILNGEMQRIKSKAPPSYKQQVLDTEKRVGILFDYLNNGTMLKPDTIEAMKTVSLNIQGRQYDQALNQFTGIMTTKTDEGTQWMVGVKRLIMMSKATPV